MKSSIKKGFTLIELLAIIIILAIIALFATPKILDVIAESRESANKSTVYGIIDAAKLYYADSVFDEEKKANIGNNTDIYELMIVNGEKPEIGTLYVNDQGRVATSITIGEKCYVKDYNSELQTYPVGDENCDLEFGDGDEIEDITPSTPQITYKCKRAETLHFDVCSFNSQYDGCGGLGYIKGDVLTFGSLGTPGELNSGDAFDCDVNGDGYYDFDNERFYYVSDLYDTVNKTFDNNYAVLIYSNNIINNIPDNTKNANIQYNSTSESYRGPIVAITNLPKTEHWTNVNLVNTNRQVLTNTGGLKIGNGNLPLLNHGEYAARLLTTQEINKSCGIETPSSSAELNNCTYLFENTGYNNLDYSDGYWLETVSSSSSVHLIYGWFRLLSGISPNVTGYDIGVRPAIEIPITDIETERGENTEIEIEFVVNSSDFNSLGWAKDDFYVTVNAKDESGVGIKKINICSTTNVMCNPTNGSVVKGSTGVRAVTTNSDTNKVCAYATDNNGNIGKVVCSDIYKLDKTVPEVSIDDAISNYVHHFNGKISPISTISGYNYEWYKDNNKIENVSNNTYFASTPGTYKLVVTTNAGLSSSSTIDISVSDINGASLCKRATKLHTEVCTKYSQGYNCVGAGYRAGSTITYGSKGTNGILSSGDAFDCDVNGDGVYDDETERFYYVSDLYNPVNNSFDSNYAVLVYYNNTKDGLPNNTLDSRISYGYNDNDVKLGPLNAVKYLPTTSQWKNVYLVNNYRQMSSYKDGVSDIPRFDYAGYAARLLTVNEIIKSCGITLNGTQSEYFNNCAFLFENTLYGGDTSKSESYWLETLYSSTSSQIYKMVGKYRQISNSNSVVSNSVRPVIEVPKSRIDYDESDSYNASIKDYTCSEGGALSSDNKQCTLTTPATLDCADGYQLVDNMCYKIDNTKKTSELVCNLAADGYSVCSNWDIAGHKHCVRDYGMAKCPDGYVPDSEVEITRYCVPAGIQSCGDSVECHESYRQQTIEKICPNGGTLFLGNQIEQDDHYIGHCYGYSSDVTINSTCSAGYMLKNNNCVSNTGTSASSCAKGTINSEGKCVYTYNSTPNYYCPQGGTLSGTICNR